MVINRNDVLTHMVLIFMVTNNDSISISLKNTYSTLHLLKLGLLVMKFAYITTSEIKTIRIVSTNIDVLYRALEKE